MIVSDIPGTTRDVVDSEIKYRGKSIILLDTAGIRRKASITKAPEIYSVLKARETIDRADLIIFIADSTQPLSHQDISIARLIHENARGVFIVLNKWDLQEDPEKSFKERILDIQDYLSHISYAPVFTTSALEGKRVFKTMDKAYEFLYETDVKIQTSILNEAILRYYTERHPPAYGTKKYIKINYAVQTNVRPCKIKIFTNRPDKIPVSYSNYLVNRLREDFPLHGIPVHITFSKK
jgi:GTP-binding protein